LANKFDKEMALTNNLLVNLDELDAIRPPQQASLKQALSVNKVNSRPIFGRTQEDRPRFASFVATTNNRHPLQDSTGSRRYICIRIPDGQMIDNTGGIDYGQLYAQVVYELQELKAPYWFNNEEVARIQQLNQEFMDQKDLGEIFVACFRQPKEGEVGEFLSATEILQTISAGPALRFSVEKIGSAMSALGFERMRSHKKRGYRVVAYTGGEMEANRRALAYDAKPEDEAGSDTCVTTF
jgi:predicted P-loop ATPase